MKEISLCMIIKNEEETIGRCLESVKDLVDEIIIVDTGSSDKSKEIVSKYTDKIYDFEWVDDFAKARNFSFSKATKDYIMWLDADDVMLEEDREKFKKLKSEMGSADIYKCIYNCSFYPNGEPKVIQNRVRIVKREKNYKWVSPIHEVIIPSGIPIIVKHANTATTGTIIKVTKPLVNTSITSPNCISSNLLLILLNADGNIKLITANTKDRHKNDQIFAETVAKKFSSFSV